MTDPTMRDFYDQMYRQSVSPNPAHEIYDTLRAQYIRDLIQSCSGQTLIVGCGLRRDFEILSPPAKLIAFDLSYEAIQTVQTSKADLFVGDALHIPLPNEQFDLVICSEVLEHIPNIRAVVGELRRVLHPNGFLIVSSPNWHSWFGLTRWVSEKLMRRPFHSNDQPYDDWKTIARYKAELSPEFQVIACRGVWYLPPLHYRSTGLPRLLTQLIYRCYVPFEFVLSRWLPAWGHLLILKCKPKQY